MLVTTPGQRCFWPPDKWQRAAVQCKLLTYLAQMTRSLRVALSAAVLQIRGCGFMHDLNSMKPPLRKSHVGPLMSFSHGHVFHLSHIFPLYALISARIATQEPGPEGWPLPSPPRFPASPPPPLGSESSQTEHPHTHPGRRRDDLQF